MKLFKNPENFKLEPYDMRNGKLSNLRMITRNEKHCQRHNGPRILSPKLELSLKDETNADSNLAL